MKKLSVGIILSLAGTAFAAAADMPAAPMLKAPIAVPYASWTGCYVGMNGGGGRSRNAWEPFGGTPLNTVRASGFFGGAQVGCDYQAGAWVFGIEGQVDWSGNVRNAALVSGAEGQVQTKLDRFATATGRVGYGFDRVLTYVKAGLAWAQFSHELDSTVNGAFVPAFAGSRGAVGFVVGAGFEVAFLPNWSFKVEYNYLDFGTNGVPLDCQPASGQCGGAIPSPIPFDIQQNVQTVMFGLNYRFGPGAVVANY
jgi:outer membrane immunogenic protein